MTNLNIENYENASHEDSLSIVMMAAFKQQRKSKLIKSLRKTMKSVGLGEWADDIVDCHNYVLESAIHEVKSTGVFGDQVYDLMSYTNRIEGEIEDFREILKAKPMDERGKSNEFHQIVFLGAIHGEAEMAFKIATNARNLVWSIDGIDDS